MLDRMMYFHLLLLPLAKCLEKVKFQPDEEGRCHHESYLEQQICFFNEILCTHASPNLALRPPCFCFFGKPVLSKRSK